MSLFQGRSKLFIAAVIAIPIILLSTLMSCIGGTTASDVTGKSTSSASASSKPEPAPVLPKPEVPAPPAPVVPAPAPAAEVSYPNCTAAKAAGAAPIQKGQPGYSTKLDRDGDGVACDK